jgi:hypothetical protein
MTRKAKHAALTAGIALWAIALITHPAITIGMTLGAAYVHGRSRPQRGTRRR